MYLFYVWSEIQNLESQLILSSDTQFSKPLPITAGDSSHVTALAVKGWRQVMVEGDLSQFQGRQAEFMSKHIVFSLEEQVLFL